MIDDDTLEAVEVNILSPFSDAQEHGYGVVNEGEAIPLLVCPTMTGEQARVANMLDRFSFMIRLTMLVSIWCFQCIESAKNEDNPNNILNQITFRHLYIVNAAIIASCTFFSAASIKCVKTNKGLDKALAVMGSALVFTIYQSLTGNTSIFDKSIGLFLATTMVAPVYSLYLTRSTLSSSGWKKDINYREISESLDNLNGVEAAYHALVTMSEYSVTSPMLMFWCINKMANEGRTTPMEAWQYVMVGICYIGVACASYQLLRGHQGRNLLHLDRVAGVANAIAHFSLSYHAILGMTHLFGGLHCLGPGALPNITSVSGGNHTVGDCENFFDNDENASYAVIATAILLSLIIACNGYYRTHVPIMGAQQEYKSLTANLESLYHNVLQTGQRINYCIKDESHGAIFALGLLPYLLLVGPACVVRDAGIKISQSAAGLFQCCNKSSARGYIQQQSNFIEL
jgi:hypothetical protein